MKKTVKKASGERSSCALTHFSIFISRSRGSRGVSCVPACVGAARHGRTGARPDFGGFRIRRSAQLYTWHRTPGTRAHWLNLSLFSILLFCVLWRDLSLRRYLVRSNGNNSHTLQAIDMALISTSQYLGAKTLEENGATYSPKLAECAAGTHQRHACALRAAGGSHERGALAMAVRRRGRSRC